MQEMQEMRVRSLDQEDSLDWEDSLEKGMATHSEVVGWHHQFNGHELEQTLGDSERQGSLAIRLERVGLDCATDQQPPPTPVLLHGEFHGQRSLLGYRPLGPKELDMAEAT